MIRLDGVLLALAAGLLRAPALAAQTGDTAAVAVAAAQVAATSWLRLVDQARYDASWDSAAPQFQSAATKLQWAQIVVQVRGPFERFGARRLLAASFTTALPQAPPGQYVVLQYETRVSRDRAVVETVVPARQPDGTWKVSGYFLRPR